MTNLGHIARERIQDGANGIAIGGSGMGESIDALNTVVNEVRFSIGGDIPILVQGIDTVDDIISVVQNGADIVSTNLPQIMTIAGLAMCFLDHMQTQENNNDHRTQNFTPPSPLYTIINVRNSTNRTDSSPILDSCRCHACRHYSRAYIYHLFKAHELLGEILLHTHNQWQLFELFRILRGVEDIE